MKKLLLTASLCLVASAGLADVKKLSAQAVAGLFRVTLANTAKEQCRGARVNDKRMQNEMVTVLTGLAREGVNPVEAVKFLETKSGKALMARQETAFRAKHGVAAKGIEPLCRAIAAELKTDRALARIVKLK